MGGKDLENAVAPIQEQISALYTYDADAGKFRTYAPSAAEPVNTLSTLAFGPGSGS